MLTKALILVLTCGQTQSFWAEFQAVYYVDKTQSCVGFFHHHLFYGHIRLWNQMLTKERKKKEKEKKACSLQTPATKSHNVLSFKAASLGEQREAKKKVSHIVLPGSDRGEREHQSHSNTHTEHWASIDTGYTASETSLANRKVPTERFMFFLWACVRLRWRQPTPSYQLSSF